jgi:putative nucleotidyltransferase with HDIG domain
MELLRGISQKRPHEKFMWAISLAGIGICITCGLSITADQVHSCSIDLVVFAALVLLSSVLCIHIPESDCDVSMTMPLAFSLFLVHNLAIGVVFSSIPYVVAQLLTDANAPVRKRIRDALFNTSNFVIALSCASLAYLLLGGEIVRSGIGYTVSWGLVVRLSLWTAIYNFINIVICTICYSLYSPVSWKGYLFDNLRWSKSNFLFSVPVSILFAFLYARFHSPGIIMLIVPWLAGWYAMKLDAREREAYRDTITTLGTYMQHYHPYTKGHLERVADLSEKIAMQMGLSAKSLTFIRDAGLLHDIGKICVNEEVLDKPGQLSDDEWKIIKQHPAHSAEILSGMKYLEAIVPWVRGHHERPDGKGYPDRLKDDAITIEAAVIAVADAFDAMTGGPEETDQRIYRKPLTLDQAIDQLRYGAGTQFNPRVVRAFQKVMVREETSHGG